MSSGGSLIDGRPHPEDVILKRTPDPAVVEVVLAGPLQRFSPPSIEDGAAKGWMVRDNGSLVIHGLDGDVRYRVVREPGYYCCFCSPAGKPAVPLASGEDARAHLAAEHPGLPSRDTPSPDPGNPGGYARLNAYESVKET